MTIVTKKKLKHIFLIFLDYIHIYCYLYKRFKQEKNSMRQLTNMTSYSNQPSWDENPMSYSLGDTHI
jgi:phosphoglycerate-specific signal transduction histidine kinase